MAIRFQDNILFNDNTTQTTASGKEIEAGTTTVFMQTSAPTGWTKATSDDDSTLRVVSGAASTGGIHGFSTVFGAGKSVGGHTIAATSIPAHTHSGGWQVTWAGTNRFGGSSGRFFAANNTSNNVGGGSSHNHTLDLDIQYVDVILASKN